MLPTFDIVSRTTHTSKPMYFFTLDAQQNSPQLLYSSYYTVTLDNCFRSKLELDRKKRSLRIRRTTTALAMENQGVEAFLAEGISGAEHALRYRAVFRIRARDPPGSVKKITEADPGGKGKVNAW